MNIIPGLVLAALLAIGAKYLSVFLGQAVFGMSTSPLSPILLAIVLGLLMGNALKLPAIVTPGLKFCLVHVLRLGIVLLGVRLSLAQAGEIGLKAIPVVLVCVTLALLLVTFVSRKMGLSSRLGTLIAAGTGICGATAIVALAPSIRARDEETSYAVACITVFGMLAMLAYPYLAHSLFAGDLLKIGLFLGTAIHDTAQVAGAGLAYSQVYGQSAALDAAIVTKLLRNLGMLVVIPLLSILYLRSEQISTERPSLWSMVPLFILAFAAMSLLRTVGDLGSPALGLIPDARWQTLIGAASDISSWCLGIAMAAVGLGTRFSGLREMGWKPLLVGLISAVVVGVVSYLMIQGLY